MRAFNDGRFLESEVKLLDQDKAISWGFALDQITTKSVLRINESGEWTELSLAEIKIGSEPPKTLLATYGPGGWVGVFPPRPRVTPNCGSEFFRTKFSIWRQWTSTDCYW